MDGSGDSGAPLALELRVFHCEEAFAYAVPPARSAAGHRAADWDVDKWLCKVHCSLCTLSGDAVPDGTAVVRLHDATTGELFAESPLGVDVPIQAVVEPVVDSSRYFVVRVEDAASKRHAFVGLGFASRDNSTDFKMALSEVQTARDRDKEAQRRRAAHQASVQQPGDVPWTEASGDGPASPPAPRQDLSLPEGTKIVLNVPVRAAVPRSKAGLFPRALFADTATSSRPQSLARRKAAAAAGAGTPPAGPLLPLPPPPGARPGLLAPPPKPGLLAPPPPSVEKRAADEDLFGTFQ